MRNRKIVALLGIIFVANFLIAEENTHKQPRYEWIDRDQVAECEDGIYVETTKGMARLDVIEYDEKTDHYLIDNLSWCKANDLRPEDYLEDYEESDS